MKFPTGALAYRFALVAAIAGAFMVIWFSLGVGIIGRDGDPANRMYVAVVAMGMVGALLGRFKPRGMSLALGAAALVQFGVAAIALIAQLGLPWSGPAEIVLLNGFFVAWFASCAWLFRRAG
jgi:hypothetical protein